MNFGEAYIINDLKMKAFAVKNAGKFFIDMVIQSQAIGRSMEGLTTTESILMTKRTCSDPIQCVGCGKDFGLISPRHIEKCIGLKKLGITSLKEYSKFGLTKAPSLSEKARENIRAFNNSMTPEQRKIHTRRSFDIKAEKYPDRMKGGLPKDHPFWANPANIEERRRRCREVIRTAATRKDPNKLENRFWDLIGRDKIVFVSFEYWKSYIGSSKWKQKFPDFHVPNTNKVIEVYGCRWHDIHNPEDRVNYWKERGIDCIVVQEKEITRVTKNASMIDRVLKFISGNSHERGTPECQIQDDDIVCPPGKPERSWDKEPNDNKALDDSASRLNTSRLEQKCSLNNGVNSGEVFDKDIKGNPDPSETRNSFEGATTR